MWLLKPKPPRARRVCEFCPGPFGMVRPHAPFCSAYCEACTSTRPTNLKQSFASHPIPCQQTKHSLDARTLSDPLSRRATWPLCVPKT
jgi:hypothetical protein